jgi:hypothetical protein
MKKKISKRGSLIPSTSHVPLPTVPEDSFHMQKATVTVHMKNKESRFYTWVTLGWTDRGEGIE